MKKKNNQKIPTRFSCIFSEKKNGIRSINMENNGVIMQRFNMNISTSDDFHWDIRTKVTADQLSLVMDIMKLVMEHSKKKDGEREQKASMDVFDIKKESEEIERLLNLYSSKKTNI